MVLRKRGFSGRVDQVNETMCDIPVFFNVVEWAANRRVDSATKRAHARVPISSNVVRPCSRCLIYKRSPSLRRGSLKGFQTHSQLSGIPLLQYADDTMFFMEGSVEEAKNLSALLDVFANCSGLHLIREKSEFTGFGLSQGESQCSRALSTPVGALPIRYLGLPLSAGQLRVADWQPVVGKVEQWLEGWKAKILSKGGRLVLLRSVLSAISVFKIPGSIEQRLSGLMWRFFWKGSKEGRGMALVAWDDICTPIDQGSLRVPHLSTMNVALLKKWVKQIIGPEDDVIRSMMRD